MCTRKSVYYLSPWTLYPCPACRASIATAVITTRGQEPNIGQIFSTLGRAHDGEEDLPLRVVYAAVYRLAFVYRMRYVGRPAGHRRHA